MRTSASALAIFALFMLPASALAQSEPVALPEVNVIAPSPLGGYVDRDKVPGTVQTLTSDDFKRTESPIATETLFQRIPGVTLSDPNGNSAAQSLSYRGFFASPVQGTPQGIAVYMSGIRFNEAFGDTVNWDLIPTNAIDRSDLWTNNPVFGLNALGGALNLTMKNGFTYQGFEGRGLALPIPCQHHAALWRSRLEERRGRASSYRFGCVVFIWGGCGDADPAA